MSAIKAGILFLIQIVTIFGIQPDYGSNCYCPTEEEKEDAFNRNVTFPTWDNYCCNNNNNNEDNFSHFGPDNVIYLLVGLAMLPISIYSAALACLAREEEERAGLGGGPPYFYPGQQPAAFPASPPPSIPHPAAAEEK